jgi:hypothetical protein
MVAYEYEDHIEQKTEMNYIHNIFILEDSEYKNTTKNYSRKARS